MFEKMTKDEATAKMLEATREYYRQFMQPKEWQDGERIPYARRVFDESEVVNLVDCSLEFWLTSGRYTDRFEREFAKYIGVPYCSLVNSGSSANLLAFAALTSPLLGERAVKRGDEVISVACAFPTTVSPILQYGAVPVFVDVTIRQYNIDVSALEAAYSEKTKAIMIAHTLGNPFDLAEVRRFCNERGLWLVEDNCDSLGSTYTIDGERRLTGAWGDIATSSFYPPHHMTMGEGGAVYTANPLLHKIVRSLRDWGRDCVCPSGHDNVCGHRFDGQRGELPAGYDHKYTYSHLGYNLKATDLQAAVGCAQIEKLPSFTQKRRHNWQFLREALDPLSVEKGGPLILPEAAANSEPSWFGFLITCTKEGLRDALVRKLEGAGVQTRMLFAGNITRHPCFDAIRGTAAYRTVGTLEATDRIMRDTFWVGVYPGMTDAMLEKIACTIRAGV